MSEPIIQVDHVKVVYNKGKSNEICSLFDVNLSIYPQEYVIIFGPSGCGKSTLLHTIAGLQTPTEGEVTLEGKKISAMDKKEIVSLHQTKVGLIFQAFYLIPSLSILDNICLPEFFCKVGKKESERHGIELLNRFGIVEQSGKFPSQLSGGQKQRVAIARALINNPQIILADEPVGNLDSESAENVLSILKELNEVDRKTIIMVTHNVEYLPFADRIIYMKDGKILKEEVNKEKRPINAVKKVEVKPLEITSEMRTLMRTFRTFTPEQVGVLLAPFKAKQLLHHILSELTDEQLSIAENYLKEVIFGNIDVESFSHKLDLNFHEGGAGWNKQRALSFSQRVGSILQQMNNIKNYSEKGSSLMAEYLVNFFGLKLDEDARKRFEELLKERLENSIDGVELEKKIDLPFVSGGVGIHKGTAKKIVREVEIIMLLKYN